MACSCRSSSLRKFVTGLVQVHQPGASLPSAQFLRSSSASTSLTNFRPAVAHGATIARANGVIGRGGSRVLHTEAQTEESVEVEENSTSTVQPKKPRGRPKKLKEPSVPTPEDEDDPALPPSESIADAEVKPKRSRGRPKSLEDPAPAVHETEDDPASGVELRKPRGRPKKLEKAPLATEDIEGSSGADAQPKKARGRPKKLEEPSLIALEVDDGAGSSAEPKESRDGEEASEESLTVPEGEDGSVVVSEEQPVVSDVKPKKARGRPKKLEEPSPTAPDVDDSVVASEEPAADSDVEPTMAQDGPMESEDASTAGPEVENGPSPALGKQPGKAKSKPKKPRAKPQKSPLSKNARKKLRSKLAEEALGGSDMFGEGEEEGDGEASRAFGTNYPEGELAYETGEQPTPRETEEVQTRDEVSISEEEDDYVDSMSPGLLGMEASDDGAPKKKRRLLTVSDPRRRRNCASRPANLRTARPNASCGITVRSGRSRRRHSRPNFPRAGGQSSDSPPMPWPASVHSTRSSPIRTTRSIYRSDSRSRPKPYVVSLGASGRPRLRRRRSVKSVGIGAGCRSGSGRLRWASSRRGGGAMKASPGTQASSTARGKPGRGRGNGRRMRGKSIGSTEHRLGKAPVATLASDASDAAEKRVMM